jgi:hypothetical protein
MRGITMIKKIPIPNKHTYDKYQNHLCHSINQYISYVKTYCSLSDCEVYLNEEQTHTAEKLNYIKMINMLMVAMKVKDNLYQLPLNVVAHCYPTHLIRKECLSPQQMMEVLNLFAIFCFGKSDEQVLIRGLPVTDYNLISNEEMNERAKTYYAYDFSVKRIRTIDGIILSIEMEDETGNYEEGEEGYVD